ncbi:unnamed protein product [Blepharisma stoltei]|uniref:RING-type domain-containing protein n=1 Tax=Blepharisma stoltei TaxID=1481888 RepID=A0AAU9I4V7_9CILI|nr:unnamed protein product [Blepharisma stoltei]
MQKDIPDLENPHDCLIQCLACNEIQDYKINLAKFHGVCKWHRKLLERNSWIECKTCRISIYVYEFQIIQCDYCMTNPQFLALECSHKFCESCIQEISQGALICPICIDTSENDRNTHEIINNPINQQDFAAEGDKSDHSPRFLDEKYSYKKLQINMCENPNEIIQNNLAEDPDKIFQNPQKFPNKMTKNQEIPNEIIPKVPSINSRPQCQKCFIGVLENINEKQFQCLNCEKKFCGKCFKCLTGKKWPHHCIDNFFGNGKFINQDLWKKNEFLKTHDLMIQICPCCNFLHSYWLKEGFIVTCKYPLCTLKPRFCLYCGKGLNLGEERLHFDQGEANPCRSVRLGSDNQKKRKFKRIRLQYFDD